MEPAKIAIVVCSHKQPESLTATLAELLPLGYPVYVWENSSEPAPVSHPQLDYLSCGENHYEYGYELCVERIEPKPEFILKCDPDISGLPDGFLNTMLSAINEPNVGAVCLRAIPIDPFTETKSIPVVFGALFLMRYTVWNDAGGWLKELPMLYNEWSMAIRLHRMGLKSVLLPLTFQHGQYHTHHRTSEQGQRIQESVDIFYKLCDFKKEWECTEELANWGTQWTP